MQVSSVTTPSVSAAHDDSSDPAQPQAPKTTVAATSAAARPEEYAHLVAKYEGDTGRPTDSGVAQRLSSLQRDSMRGEPAQNVDFETAQLPLMQKISALPPRQRAYYSGAQAQVVNSFELAKSPPQRQRIGQGFSMLQKQVDGTYAKTMQDLHPPQKRRNIQTDRARPWLLVRRRPDLRAAICQSEQSAVRDNTLRLHDTGRPRDLQPLPARRKLPDSRGRSGYGPRHCPNLRQAI